MLPKIFLVFPCYNPEPSQWESLEQYILKLKQISKAEIQTLVIDDGSHHWANPPDSFQKHTPIIRNKSNQGKGGILKQAVEKMPEDCSVFAFLDFDIPYSIDDLLGICASIWAGVDICIGDRTGIQKKVLTDATVSDRASRGFAHKIFRFFFATFITGGIHDTQCGVKAYDAKIIKAIVKKAVLNGFLFDVEWLYIGMKHKLAVRTWPVQLQDHHSSSRLRSFLKISVFAEIFLLVRRILAKKYLSTEVLNCLNDRRNLQKKQLY